MIKKKNILFVVHRYAPYPGGSEYYVQNAAEEAVRRGHDATVLTHEHRIMECKLNGVFISTDFGDCLNRKWDLMVVHGDANSQNIVLTNSYSIRSPILYMIIKPSESEHCLHGMKYSDFLGYSTSMDWQHIKKYGQLDKARRVRHGVSLADTLVPSRYSTGPYYVSAGGFYPNKKMTELADAWVRNDMKPPLHIYGYGMENLAPKETDKVKIHVGKPKSDVMTAIKHSAGYIQNSSEEGFGLVLLEAMLNKVPWYAKDIAGAHDMARYGTIYSDEDDLIKKLDANRLPHPKAYEYAMQNHLIQHTVDDIDDILIELEKRTWT